MDLNTEPTEPEYAFYLKIADLPGGRVRALCTDGDWSLGHTGAVVLDAMDFNTKDEAHTWFHRVAFEQPWKVKH